MVSKGNRVEVDLDEDISALTWSKQQELLQSIVHCSLIKKYPVNNEFSRLYFKKLISCLEKAGQEVHDELYIGLCNIMNNTSDDNLFRYRHHIIGNDFNNIITIKETKNMVVNGTTGMKTWEAAFMLVDWALCNQGVFRDKTVFELGSGVGFTGIVISKFCKPREMILSDCHDDVLKMISDNIEINFPNMTVKEVNNCKSFVNEKHCLGTMNLDWNNDNNMENIALKKPPDIIIGADIVYDPSLLLPLCNVIQDFLQSNNNIEIYIASVIRNEATFETFLSILDTKGLTYHKLQQEESVFVEWDNTIQRCLLKIKMLS
ncbi:protein-lysine N-methyltransferase EEF2KMT isoform X2 [Galleria mellonella]|uniref:Protein-lysine N-methyltransferase EEF2KMT isoform X2 n=1 Tax=Galleria mellonella TaxID=7137 RepID=A0ABM3N1F6_GALME|nr:protein-lysine N-methyltransferase EEF2KMT isoform X2 [Galleria mellonella]